MPIAEVSKDGQPQATRLTRTDAAQYLTTIGLPIAATTLAKKAVDGSGPPFRIGNGRALYETADLNEWAQNQLGPSFVPPLNVESSAMSNDHEIVPPPQPSFDTKESITEEARSALVAFDAYNEDSIELALKVGAIISKAKKVLKHGEFTPWCQQDLKRKPSWCAALRQLFEAGQDLDAAREWAKRKEHPFAHSASVERLLDIIKEWRAETGHEQPKKRKAKSGSKVHAVKSEIEVNEQPEAPVLHVSLPPHIHAVAAHLAKAIVQHESETGMNLLGLVVAFLTDAVESRGSQTCGRPQLSGPKMANERKDMDDTMTPLQRLKLVQEKHAGRN